MINKLKIVAGLTVGLLAGAFAGATLFPVTEEKTVTETVTETVEVPVIVENKTTEIVEIEKEVEVPSDNDRLFFKALKDKGGDLTFVTDGLDNNEIEEVVDRLVFYYDTQSISESEVRQSAKTSLNNLVVNGEQLDSRDISRVTVVDSSVDVNDFDSKDAVSTVVIVFLHDGDKYEATFEADYLAGEVVDVDVTSVALR